jgi:hypothetical protein
MKKLVFGVLSILVIVSLCQCSCNSPSITYKTLNDVDGVTAGEMIQHFDDLRGNDNAPVSESFWISKEMIHDIVTLLDKEVAVEKARRDSHSKDTLIGIPDGIRIYFASDPTISTYPLNNTILLVSTKDNGKAPAGWKGCKSGRRHLDYYEHSTTDGLFKLSNHEIKCESAGCPGDSLYFPVIYPDTNCRLPHDISRKEAVEMVHYFTEKHTINTKGAWIDLSFFETMDKDTVLNGIRIYFARHKICQEDTTKNYRDAFVITTTKRNPKTGLTADYFDCDTIDGTSATYEKAYRKKYNILPVTNVIFSGPQDNTELCPDNCN